MVLSSLNTEVFHLFVCQWCETGKSERVLSMENWFFWRKVGVARLKSEKSSGFHFPLLLIGRFPSKNSHRNVIGAIQIPLHLDLQIFVGVKTKVIVESFLIVAVTTLHFAIVPRCSRANKLMGNMQFCAQAVKRMNALCFFRMGKLSAIVCLNDVRSISKPNDCTLYDIAGRVTSGLSLCINKTLSAGFF